MKDKEYISDFDDSVKTDNPVNPDGPIDFSIVQKLEGNTGSICDVYVAQYHQTKVLIKKLKSHLKNKVLYKNALEKEFTLGFRLKHNSLPTYREFHGDYIIMEFIEGDTLLSLLQRKDTWLSKEGSIRKLLIQLLDVLSYLHSNGITHCDIKPDNIILSKGHHNVVLIDLDKTYTAFNPNSAGNTSHFDIEESKAGHPDMDFHGVGKLVDRIIGTYPGLPVKKLRKFEAKCMRNNVQADDLMEWLESYNSHNGKKLKNKKDRSGELIGFGGMICCIVILAVVGLVLDSRNRDSQKENTPIINSIPQEEPRNSTSDDTEVSVSKPSSEIPINENKSNNERIKDSYKKEIEKQMATRILPLISVVEEGELILANPNSTDNELRELSEKLSITYCDILQQAYSDFENQYPEIEPLEVQMTVISSPSFKKGSKEFSGLIQKITDEIVARNPDSYP